MMNFTCFKLAYWKKGKRLHQRHININYLTNSTFKSCLVIFKYLDSYKVLDESY